jgi:hypothetical protein
MDQVRQLTTRMRPLNTAELIAKLNPLLRGWGEYYKRAPRSASSFNVSTVGSDDASGRIGSGRWRNADWKQLPAATLYGEYELVRLLSI